MCNLFSSTDDIYRYIRHCNSGLQMDLYNVHLCEALTEYKNGCYKIYEDALKSRERSRDMSQSIVRTIDLFKELCTPYCNTAEYQHRICELLAIYISCELRLGVESSTEKQLLIGKRIIYIMRKHLNQDDKEQTQYNILRTLVYIPRLFNAREIICEIFEEFIPLKPVSEVYILPDKLYILYIIVFFRWISMQQDNEAKQIILNFAESFMKPSITLPRSKLYEIHLPTYETYSAATRCILNNLICYKNLRNASIIDNALQKIGTIVNLCDDEDLDDDDVTFKDTTNFEDFSEIFSSVQLEASRIRIPSNTKLEEATIVSNVDLTKEEEGSNLLDKHNKWLNDFQQNAKQRRKCEVIIQNLKLTTEIREFISLDSDSECEEGNLVNETNLQNSKSNGDIKNDLYLALRRESLHISSTPLSSSIVEDNDTDLPDENAQKQINAKEFESLSDIDCDEFASRRDSDSSNDIVQVSSGSSNDFNGGKVIFSQKMPLIQKLPLHYDSDCLKEQLLKKSEQQKEQHVRSNTSQGSLAATTMPGQFKQNLGQSKQNLEDNKISNSDDKIKGKLKSKVSLRKCKYHLIRNKDSEIKKGNTIENLEMNTLLEMSTILTEEIYSLSCKNDKKLSKTEEQKEGHKIMEESQQINFDKSLQIKSVQKIPKISISVHTTAGNKRVFKIKKRKDKRSKKKKRKMKIKTKTKRTNNSQISASQFPQAKRRSPRLIEREAKKLLEQEKSGENSTSYNKNKAKSSPPLKRPLENRPTQIVKQPLKPGSISKELKDSKKANSEENLTSFIKNKAKSSPPLKRPLEIWPTQIVKQQLKPNSISQASKHSQSLPETTQSVSNLRNLMEFNSFIENLLAFSEKEITNHKSNIWHYYDKRQNYLLEKIAILEHYNSIPQKSIKTLHWRLDADKNIWIFNNIDIKWMQLPPYTANQLLKLSIILSATQQELKLKDDKERIRSALKLLINKSGNSELKKV